MVSVEETLKFMENRAKRKKKSKPSTTSSASPLLSPSIQGEKRKDPKPGPRPTKCLQRLKKES